MTLIRQHFHCLSEFTMIYSYSCNLSSHWIDCLGSNQLGPDPVRGLAWRGEELLLLTPLCPHSHLWAPVCQIVFSAVTMSTQEFPLLVLVGDV